MQARKNIVRMLRQLIDGRRASKLYHQDMLGRLMRTEENKFKLTDEEIIDQIITILYSGYETVSTTSMMAVKYLHDHPRVLQELRVSLDNKQNDETLNGFKCLYIFVTFLCSWLNASSLCRKSISQLEKRKGLRIQSI